MISYFRRFHAPGRRKRLKSKLKVLLQSHYKAQYTQAYPEKLDNKHDFANPVMAGPKPGKLSRRAVVEMLDDLALEPNDTLCEKAHLKASLEERDICPTVCPPSYGECVGHDHQGVDGTQVSTNWSHDSKVVTQLTPQSTEDSLESPALPTTHELERGRKRDILYRSQLNDLATRKGMRRPSPKKNRMAKALPQALICFSMIIQLDKRVEGWNRGFVALKILVLLSLLLIYGRAIFF
ncbi:hypothetical protein PUMCH_001091 [Australozyma saopauloensis]|uniref:Uncharacterized protein n=1 Tax=Australozyma saopauloensis TaxID=291208 RepID=A0AAX4H6I6_9ASCO|nr:hypothetical protein PUMCH_001091 [[Candida] saopauloensis]